MFSKLKKIIGWLMVVAPFVGLFIFICIDGSFVYAVIIFGGTAVLVGWIVIAVQLMVGE